MNDIGWGLLLNLLFWVLVISAMVIVAAWASVEFFHGAAQRARKTVRVLRGRKESPNPPQTYEDAEERYRKAS